MKEKEIYLLNLDVQNRQKNNFQYKNEIVFEEVLDTINKLQSKKVLNYNFGVGELISYLKENEVKCYGYSPYGISYSFAKKLFKLDIENCNKSDLLIIENAEHSDIEKLFKISSKILMINPNFDLDSLDKTKYNITRNTHTVLLNERSNFTEDLGEESNFSGNGKNSKQISREQF